MVLLVQEGLFRQLEDKVDQCKALLLISLIFWVLISLQLSKISVWIEHATQQFITEDLK
jgi:hypothetical protein